MSTAPASSVRAELARRWQAMSERERQGVSIAGTVIVVLVVWMVALQPALRTLSDAPVQRQQAQLELLQMQQLAAETQELRKLPPMAASQAVQAVQAATGRLGERAKLVPQGERMVVTLTNVQPEQLRSWLDEVRSGARARPIDAQLTRGAQGLSGTVTLVAGSAS